MNNPHCSPSKSRRIYFVGMETLCRGCQKVILVTESMCRRSKYRCGTCESAASKQYQQRNLEKAREWRRDASKRVPSEVRAERGRIYRTRYPERRRAHNAVQTALRNGSLQKQPCVHCGELNSHAHHDDYSKPLDVIWLCHRHHMERHAALNKEPQS